MPLKNDKIVLNRRLHVLEDMSVLEAVIDQINKDFYLSGLSEFQLEKHRPADLFKALSVIISLQYIDNAEKLRQLFYRADVDEVEITIAFQNSNSKQDLINRLTLLFLSRQAEKIKRRLKK